MHLDSKAGDFFNFDKHPLKNFQKQIQEARDGRDEAKVERIKWRMDSFSQRCIISPVRPQRQGPLQRQWVSQNGTPLNARVRESTETPWHASMATHYKLCKSTAVLNDRRRSLVANQNIYLSTLRLQQWECAHGFNPPCPTVAGRFCDLSYYPLHAKTPNHRSA